VTGERPGLIDSPVLVWKFPDPGSLIPVQQPGTHGEWSPEEPGGYQVPFQDGETVELFLTGLPRHTYLRVGNIHDVHAPNGNGYATFTYTLDGSPGFAGPHTGSTATWTITCTGLPNGVTWGLAQVDVWCSDVLVGVSSSGPVYEGETGALYISRSPSWGSDAVTVAYSVSGSATPGEDYELITDSVTIPEGEPGAEIQIVTIDDNFVEPTEDVIVSLLPSDQYVIDPDAATASLDILDNEPTITLDVISGSEAPRLGQTTGTTPVTLRFGLDRPAAHSIPLNLTIAEGTADAGQDYMPFTVAIPPATHGETSVDIEMPVVDGAVKEWSETFTVTLNESPHYRLPKTAAGVTIPQGPITGYIKDNDGVDLVLKYMGEAIEETPGLVTGVGGDLIPLTLAMPKYESGTEV
jgi:hypothetical protein